jgi:hypothetical protein
MRGRSTYTTRCGTQVGAAGKHLHHPVQRQVSLLVVSYRNFMMLCAVLMDQRMKPEYSSLIIKPIPPGVSNLKVWIEEAWRNGEYLHRSARRMP